MKYIFILNCNLEILFTLETFDSWGEKELHFR